MTGFPFGILKKIKKIFASSEASCLFSVILIILGANCSKLICRLSLQTSLKYCKLSHILSSNSSNTAYWNPIFSKAPIVQLALHQLALTLSDRFNQVFNHLLGILQPSLT